MNPVVPLVLGLSALMQKKVKMKTAQAPAPRVKRQGRARFAARPKEGAAAAAPPAAGEALEGNPGGNDAGPGGPDTPDEGGGAGDAVAELEAVIGASDDDEPVEKREAEEPSNFLAMYFKDMARLAVLRPQEEFESARKLESLEVALWARVLSHAPVTEHALKVCERTLENSIAEFKTIRKHLVTLKKRHSKAEQERFERCVVKTSEKLRALDTDKRILDIVLDDIHKVIHAQPGRVIDDVASFNPKSRDFKKYLSDVGTAYARAQSTKNEFVKANLRLVVSIARRFNYGRMPLADLIQEGNIGLIKAVERYDYRRGYRFSTYASWWIRHAISRALADKGRAVRLPVHMIDAYHRVAKSQARAVGQARAAADQRGDRRGDRHRGGRRSRRCARSCSISRSRSTARSRTRTGASSSTSSRTRTPRTAPRRTRWSTTRCSPRCARSSSTLKPIEADILRQRFGLDTDQELTLKEIGEKYNLSRERIRQLQEQALGKMRRALQRKDLM